MGGFQAQNQRDSGVSEYCYLLKYVEKNGRAHLSDPWSIRQTAIYHRFVHRSDDHTFIILNSSASSRQRLLRTKAETTLLPTWADVHTLAASRASAQWRAYLNELEEKLEFLKSKAHNSDTLNGVEKADSFTFLQYTDVQDLEVLHDKTLRIIHILTTNFDALRSLSFHLNRHSPSTHPVVDLTIVQDCGRLQVCITEIALQRQRAETIVKRLDAVGQLSLISVRALEALHSSGRISTGLMKLAQTDSNRMLDLSKKAHYDSRSLKTITVLTLVYLPASFASQLLSMGYVSLNRDKNPESLQFASEFWIFVVLTVILLVATIGAWLLLEHRRAKRRAHDDEEVGTSSQEKI
ncbi:magnesium transport protein transmembrane region [Diplodia corticola]|uniref:Magnesium transport protein transmembrane region n=1 Tax=Diplodia corticola TaxID=236234 RepID=A0A1J9RLE2_9PEZI|nr:magnesium transport protein transmembrane region [Diplodia corticola]OJD40786.1 magnesium transport protein transmembrane region [Diplodia corticola]